MATAIAKTYVIPVVASVRMTCAGTQYTVETPEYVDVVTVNGGQMTCTCHQANCLHARFVNLHRAQGTAKDAHRASYEATFDLSYGD